MTDEKQSDGRVEVVKALVGKARDVLMTLLDLLTLAVLGKSHPVLDDEEALVEVSSKLDALAEGLTVQPEEEDLPDGEVDTTAEPEPDDEDKDEEATEDGDGKDEPAAGDPEPTEETDDAPEKKDGGGTDEDAKE